MLSGPPAGVKQCPGRLPHYDHIWYPPPSSSGLRFPVQCPGLSVTLPEPEEHE